MFSIDLLADLPPPRDDEPPSLRGDIADELADHLQCAYRREMLKDGDDDAAQQRVLDRFGDPKNLARRLWWQSMWSRIMGQRILSGLQWLVSLAAVVLVGAVLWQQSQMLTELRTAKQEEQTQRQALTAALDQLRAQRVAPRASPNAEGAPVPMDGEAVYESPRVYESPLSQGNGDPYASYPEGPYTAPPDPHVAPTDGRSSLTVKFVLEKEDGPPVSPENVSLNGNPGSWTGATEDEHHIPIYDNHDVIFGLLEPGRYELRIRLADGQHCTRPVLIRDNSPHELTIVCPSPREKAMVLVSMPPLPADLQDVAYEVDYWIQQRPVVLDEVDWQPPSDNFQVLSFDPKTGKATSLGSRPPGGLYVVEADLSKVKADDCVVFVAAGPVGIRYDISLRNPEAGPGPASGVSFPPQEPSSQSSSFLPLAVEPGNNHWNVELPEELLALARRRCQQLQSANNNAPLPPPPVDGPGDLPSANTKPPQLIVKLVQERTDGPPVSVDTVLIQSASRQERADEQEAPQRFIFNSLVPDQYELTVALADGQTCTRPVLIRDEKPRELTMICPGPRNKVPVSITIKPLPEKLQKFNVELNLWPGPVEIGGTRWTMRNLPSQKITFDAQTGLPTAIETSSHHLDLRDLPSDERSVFLPVGTVCCRFEASKRLVDPRGVPVYEWPSDVGEGESALKHTITAEETAWEIELPQAYLDEMLSGDNANTIPR